MNLPRSRHPGRRARLAVLATLCTLVPLAAAQPASALELTDISTPVTGQATWFYALGGPYGGCGMPQSEIDSQNFVALNVYNLPGDYSTFYNRPMAASLADKMGLWNNGHNCGRWVEVTIGDYCTGDNDGAMNKPFCRNGEWVTDKYNGAKLNMLVADSCGDGNAWCRDDPYHLDLAEASLNKFVKDGAPVGDMNPNHWNNRKISWKFIEAPDYSGDIRIGFLQSAQPWWPAIAVSHLPNGLHGVEYYQDGTWKTAEMNGDMGQSYILGGTSPGGSDFSIRVRDVDDELINDGRVYNFTFPSSCAPVCQGAYTATTYTTSTSPEETVTTTSSDGTVTTTTSGGSSDGPSCTATYRNSQAWPGGFQGEVTVTAGDSAVKNWTVSWTTGSGESIIYAWNTSLTTSGTSVTAKSVAYNAALAAGGSVTFGFVANGSSSAPALSCSAS